MSEANNSRKFDYLDHMVEAITLAANARHAQSDGPRLSISTSTWSGKLFRPRRLLCKHNWSRSLNRADCSPEQAQSWPVFSVAVAPAPTFTGTT